MIQGLTVTTNEAGDVIARTTGHRYIGQIRTKEVGNWERPVRHETQNRFLKREWPECEERLFRGEGTKNLYYAVPKSALSTSKIAINSLGNCETVHARRDVVREHYSGVPVFESESRRKPTVSWSRRNKKNCLYFIRSGIFVLFHLSRAIFDLSRFYFIKFVKNKILHIDYL